MTQWATDSNGVVTPQTGYRDNIPVNVGIKSNTTIVIGEQIDSAFIWDIPNDASKVDNICLMQLQRGVGC